MPGDTWGISGPDFLKAYLGTLFVFVVLAILIRLSATRMGTSEAGRLPDPAEAATMLAARSRVNSTGVESDSVPFVCGTATPRMDAGECATAAWCPMLRSPRTANRRSYSSSDDTAGAGRRYVDSRR